MTTATAAHSSAGSSVLTGCRWASRSLSRVSRPLSASEIRSRLHSTPLQGEGRAGYSRLACRRQRGVPSTTSNAGGLRSSIGDRTPSGRHGPAARTERHSLRSDNRKWACWELRRWVHSGQEEGRTVARSPHRGITATKDALPVLAGVIPFPPLNPSCQAEVEPVPGPTQHSGIEGADRDATLGGPRARRGCCRTQYRAVPCWLARGEWPRRYGRHPRPA